MNLKLVSLGIVAALGFAACSTETNTNANRAATGANSNVAVVTNSNGTSNSVSPVSTTNTNGAKTGSLNYNGTAKENESQRSSIESQAKEAGGKIGKGAEDWWIWAKTNNALMTSTTLSSSAGIDVDVDNSKITLRGTVPKQSDIQEADKIAKGISGQKGVSNQLKVDAKAGGGGNSNSKSGNMNK